MKVAKFPVVKGTYEYGNIFEHFIILEIIRLNSYFQKDCSFSYLQTHHNLEIDLVIERPRQPTILCEIRSTQNIDKSDLSSMLSIKKDFPEFQYYCISMDGYEKDINGIQCLPWQKGIAQIFGFESRV